jgi:hypothetical protein
MYFKIFLECFILTNETKIPLNGLVLGVCYDTSFQNLIHEINDDLVVHKKVFRMTQLLEKYKAYLPAYTGTYSSAKLQDRLVKHYAGSIVIHTQRGHGMSNLVFSVL